MDHVKGEGRHDAALTSGLTEALERRLQHLRRGAVRFEVERAKDAGADLGRAAGQPDDPRGRRIERALKRLRHHGRADRDGEHLPLGRALDGVERVIDGGADDDLDTPARRGQPHRADAAEQDGGEAGQRGHGERGDGRRGGGDHGFGGQRHRGVADLGDLVGGEGGQRDAGERQRREREHAVHGGSLAVREVRSGPGWRGSNREISGLGQALVAPPFVSA